MVLGGMPVNEEERAALIERRQKRHERIQEIGMDPEKLAEIVVQGIKDETFYILADPDRTTRAVRLRMEGILNGTGPSAEAAV